METAKKQFRKRNAILSFLRQTKEHPSAEMVFNHLKQEIPDLSLGTVYRNLSMFKAQGEIISLGTVNGVERFDGNVDPHVHFICGDCAGVIDLPQIQVPEELNRQVEKATGGSVDTCHLTFTGRCEECNMKQGGITA
jgi:Fur family peroxide stress response transcriptional regulator